MKKLSLLLIALLILPAPAAFANDPDNCPPTGAFVGPQGPYDYIANGVPTSSSCWYKNNVVYWSGYDSCGSWSTYWGFGAGTASLSQRFTVPSDPYISLYNLKLTYTLDFIDPTSNGDNNAIITTITDITTGQWIGGNSYSSWIGSAHCAREIAFAGSSTNLAGHTIEVKFTTRKANDPSISIAVKYISIVAN